MPGKPLPDDPVILRALFDEAKRFLDTTEPFLAAAALSHATIAATLNDPSARAEARSYLEGLDAEMDRERPRVGYDPTLIYDYMTQEEFDAIKASHQNLRRWAAAADEAMTGPDPGVAIVAIQMQIRFEETPPEALAIVVRRLYRKIAAKLAELPPTTPTPRRAVAAPNEARDRFVYEEMVVKGRAEKTVRAEVNATPGWPHLMHRQSTEKARDAHIRRNGLPPAPKRRKGRPKKNGN